VFENRVLRRVFGPENDEVTGEWRKLHNGQLHNLYSSPDIIRQITSRRMRWAGHVARMGRRDKCKRFWWESPKERDHLEDRGIDGRMGLEWILGRRVWSGFTWVGVGAGGGAQHGDEPSGSVAMELATEIFSETVANK
jgi:hypothetical protein